MSGGIMIGMSVRLSLTIDEGSSIRISNTQCFVTGKPDSVVVSGTLKSIKEHNLPHEVLSATETRERFPMMHLADDEIGVYETNAGKWWEVEGVK